MFFLRKRKYQIISVVCLFIFFIIIFLLFSDIGYKRLKPGQEITLTVDPKTNQADYNSTLRIHNENNIKLKISADYDKNRWYDSSRKFYYDIKSQKKIQVDYSDGKLKKAVIEPDKSENVSFKNNEFIISFTGEKTFDVTNNKRYEIKIKNMSNHSGKISAVVENE